jgi:hypothetical protein
VKIALITPIDMLDLAGLSDYHLLLPHLFDNEQYRRFYTDVKGFKILDNGAAEGYSTDHNELHDLGLAWSVDEIVVPDVLGDCDATIDLARKFEPYVREHDFRYVGVAQGRTIAELLKCITYFQYAPWITTLALPRHINTIHHTQRFNLIEPIVKEFKFDAVHCLGASSWIREVLAIDSLGCVRGMDTSLPVVLGLEGMALRDDNYVPRQPDFFDRQVERKGYTWEVIYDNCRTYLDWGGQRIVGLDEDAETS